MFVITQDVPPRMIDKGRSAYSGSTIPPEAFSPGKFGAWGVVYDIGRRQRLCQVRVQSTIGPMVPYTSGPPDEALVKHYVSRARSAASAELASNDPRLKLDF